MSGPSDRRFDLNLVEEAATPSPDNIWRSSFLSPTGPLIVGDSVMKNDITVAVVARNLLTPKDNRLLSKRSDELAVKDSLALRVQCAGSVSNMAQRLFARTRQVESLAAEVISLFQRHLLPSSSGAVPRNEAPNDQPLMPPPSRVLSSTEAPNDPSPETLTRGMGEVREMASNSSGSESNLFVGDDCLKYSWERAHMVNMWLNTGDGE
ncbi:unnamed protein product [Malus baccata var. baccata]